MGKRAEETTALEADDQRARTDDGRGVRADDAAADELRAIIGIEATAPSDPDPWITADQAAAYLGFKSVHALHKLTSADGIPFEQDAPNCKLYFKRSALDRWREDGGAGRAS
jgi:hypothetical protein